MDKKLKNFLGLSGLLIAFFLLVLNLFIYIYRYSTLSTYNYLILFFIFLTLSIMLIFMTSIISVYYTYRMKKVYPFSILFLKIGLRIVLPLASNLIGLLKWNKESIRSLYISVNNIIVQSGNLKYRPDNILVLLPHCLQNSECNHKITTDIVNCKRCGKCCIGSAAEISRELGIYLAVATGGTSARNIVSKRKPQIILSVACERDLLSGILEVGKIPVIGLVNERPHGPCYNTTIDINIFKEKLESIIEKD